MEEIATIQTIQTFPFDEINQYYNPHDLEDGDPVLPEGTIYDKNFKPQIEEKEIETENGAYNLEGFVQPKFHLFVPDVINIKYKPHETESNNKTLPEEAIVDDNYQKQENTQPEFINGAYNLEVISQRGGDVKTHKEIEESDKKEEEPIPSNTITNLEDIDKVLKKQKEINESWNAQLSELRREHSHIAKEVEKVNVSEIQTIVKRQQILEQELKELVNKFEIYLKSSHPETPTLHENGVMQKFEDKTTYFTKSDEEIEILRRKLENMENKMNSIELAKKEAADFGKNSLILATFIVFVFGIILAAF